MVKLKKTAVFALTLLACFFGGAAYADGTDIDRSAYVSADAYDNIPIDFDQVMVGIDYGRWAVDEAKLVNSSGNGFGIGHHDANREFSAFTNTASSDITVKFSPAEAGSWRIKLKNEYRTRARATIVAKLTGGYIEKEGQCWRVFSGSFDNKAQCESAIEESGLSGAPYCSSAFCISILDNRDQSLICSLDYGEKSVSLLPLGDGDVLTDYGAERYRGSFKADADTNGLTVINYVPLESYVKGVIPYEMSSSWPIEALKAQAICARTYAVYNKDGYDHYGFDVTDDTYSQVYRGVLFANDTTDLAVDSTAGLTVRYEGQVCEIYYSASDGGATEDGINVFGVDLPYLKGVYDPFEDYINYDIKDWQKKLTGQEICQRLIDDGEKIGTVTEIVPTLSDMGNVIAMTFSDADGVSVTITGRWCYNILGLHISVNNSLVVGVLQAL